MRSWVAWMTAAILLAGCAVRESVRAEDPTLGSVVAAGSSTTTRSPRTTRLVATTIFTTTIFATTIFATTTSAPPASTTSTTVVDPLDAARAQYLRIAGGANAQDAVASDKFFGAGETMPWSNVPAFCAESAPIDDAFAAALHSTSWPLDVQDEINEQVAAQVAVAGLERNCAAAGGTAAAQSRYTDGITTAIKRAITAATATRLALGLPVDR